MTEFIVENGQEWAGALADAFVDLGVSGEAELIDLADDIKGRMKERAPYDETRSGGRHGRSSIDSRKGRDREGLFIDVGATEKGFWLGFHEFGTSKMPAKPWARPAIEEAIAGWGQ